MGTGIEVPLEAAIAAWLVAIALGALIERKRQSRKQGSSSDPLTDLFAPSILGNVIDSANLRRGRRDSMQAVLRGRIGQIAASRTGWDAQTREEVLGHVAAVMKAGIRPDDNFISAGDGFTIVLSGTGEGDAKRVANRLRRALALIKPPQFAAHKLFTASFGVAAGPPAGSTNNLVARALAALEAAQMAGTDHVVAASEIEEVIFLPAPDWSAEAA